jgi:hypothetical protein
MSGIGDDMEFKKVSEHEYNLFIKNYNNELSKDIAMMVDPPVLTHNDFSNDKVWPESVVAKRLLNTAMKGTSAYNGEPDDFYVLI